MKKICIIIPFIFLLILGKIKVSADEGVWDFINTIPLKPAEKVEIIVEVQQPETTEVTIDNHNGMKTWMPYNLFTKTSKQYELQQMATTDSEGFRQINGRYMVAVGTGVGANVGQFIDIYLENGEIIPAIVADIKSPSDTKSDNITTASSGCVAEFIVNKKQLNSDVKYDGDVSSLDESYDSPVVKIIVYEKMNLLGD